MIIYDYICLYVIMTNTVRGLFFIVFPWDHFFLSSVQDVEFSKDKVRRHHDFVRRTVRLVRKLDPEKRPIHDSWSKKYGKT